MQTGPFSNGVPCRSNSSMSPSIDTQSWSTDIENDWPSASNEKDMASTNTVAVSPEVSDRSWRSSTVIVNSPLVKTAVHGADPNWGRIAMAIGKCSDDTDIDQEHVVIRLGEQELYPAPADEAALAELEEYLRGDEVLIHVSLNVAAGTATVYGCDLTDGYVRINADYTT